MGKLFAQIICCCFFVSAALAQNDAESGLQNILNFSQKEYNASSQNLAIMQNKRGIMYIGNFLGLLEFDGANWRLYQVPNKTALSCVANGNNGEIFVGAVGDLGYFLPNSAEGLKFHSLLNFLPNDKRGFSTVWDVCVSAGKVYFRTDKYIFIWDTEKKVFKIIQGAHNFHGMYLVDGKIFAREWEKGLEVFQGDSLVLLKGGEKFANERVYVMLPFPGEKGTSLIVTRATGFFKYDGNQFTPFKTDVDKFIKDNGIYRPGAILSDGNILLGTLNGGAVVINGSGKEIRRYNMESGIINNTVNAEFQDRFGSIWLVTDDGISRIDYSSPLSYFDRRNNFSGSVSDITRYNGAIYTATGNGVYFLKPGISSFQLLKNSGSQSWAFAKTGNELLVGTNEGLFKIEKDSLSPIRKSIGREYNVNGIIQSLSNPNRIYVGANGGLYSILKSGNKWIDEGRLVEDEDQKASMIEDSAGRVWMGTYSSGLYMTTFQKNKNGNIVLENPVTQHFDKKNGLVDGTVGAYKWNGINYFVTSDSIYKFDERKKIFYTDSSDKIVSEFYKIANNGSVTFVAQDSLGRIWIGTKQKLAMGTLQTNGSWEWLTAPFNKFADGDITGLLAEKNGIVWFGISSLMLKYDFGKKGIGNVSFAALVRKVNIGNDSTIYLGAGADSTIAPEISFKNNSVKFSYSATSYEDKNSNQFKTFLEGFDKGWSSWSKETVKEYTNLPPGKYGFNVSALNISGIESSAASYSFEILPPWYRTWWAYSLYIIAFTLLSVLIWRWMRHRVIAKERQQSEFREAKLKAEVENEQRKNIELISEMGKDITSSLSIEHIIDTVYAHVNKLMDASIFGIGIINKDKQKLDFPATKEKGETLPAYSYDIDDKRRPASWSFNNKKEIFMNDFEKEHLAYISDITEAAEGDNTESIIYLPLIYKEKSIGVITAQSFSKNAYNNNHLNILRSLATYTAVALDNADAYRSLKSTQTQLIQSEKMASLGELTAGIAHEIQNPLNFVNNFSEINKELLEELKAERLKPNAEREEEKENELINDVIANEEKINHHGKRADAIVKGMLQHSRSSTNVKESVNINSLADEYLRLAYHGLRAKEKSFNATLKTDFDESIGKINIIPQDIGRVLLNLYNNAFYAVAERKPPAPKGEQGSAQTKYEPTVTVSTRLIKPPLGGSGVEIKVIDNGGGIPQKVLDKIFQPFFTTKPTGQGTGLGLSLSYDIIKAHGGEIKVDNKEGIGAEFIIVLPIIS